MAASSAAPALLRRLFCSSTPAFSSSVLRATFCSSAGFGPSAPSSIFGDGTEVANVPPLTTPKLFVSGNRTRHRLPSSLTMRKWMTTARMRAGSDSGNRRGWKRGPARGGSSGWRRRRRGNLAAMEWSACCCLLAATLLRWNTAPPALSGRWDVAPQQRRAAYQIGGLRDKPLKQTAAMTEAFSAPGMEDACRVRPGAGVKAAPRRAEAGGRARGMGRRRRDLLFFFFFLTGTTSRGERRAEPGEAARGSFTSPGERFLLLCFRGRDKNGLVPFHLDCTPFIPNCLSRLTTDEKLKGAFAPFGRVLEAKVVTDRVSGRSKGFGFVRYATIEEAERARQEMNAKFLDGWVIFVDPAKPRQPKPAPEQDNRSSHAGFTTNKTVGWCG